MNNIATGNHRPTLSGCRVASDAGTTTTRTSIRLASNSAFWYWSRAPVDLLIANISAGPLVELAPSFVKAVAPGASMVLAGLLDIQADAVIAAYRAQGMTVAERGTEEWYALVLQAA